jgi:hypothetical protein
MSCRSINAPTGEIMRIEPGVWYLGFLCPKCTRFSAMMEDFTGGATRPIQGISYHGDCHHCRAPVEVRDTKVIRQKVELVQSDSLA